MLLWPTSAHAPFYDSPVFSWNFVPLAVPAWRISTALVVVLVAGSVVAAALDAGDPVTDCPGTGKLPLAPPPSRLRSLAVVPTAAVGKRTTQPARAMLAGSEHAEVTGGDGHGLGGGWSLG